MRLRIRGPNGQSTMSLSPESTVGDLLDKIRNDQSISNPDIKIGYPPQPFALRDYPRSWPLGEIGVKLDNEQLTVSDADPPPIPPPAPVVPSADQNSQQIPRPRAPGLAPKPSLKDYEMEPPEIPLTSQRGTLVLRIMPDDNSCMFRAFGFAFFGSDLDNMIELRSVVAQSIQANPADYNEAVLGEDPDAYCAKIQTPDQWGGAIELGILAQHFGIEVCAVDVETSTVYRFNQTSTASSCCILVYSGIHYDTIVLNQSSPPYRSADGDPSEDIKLFDAGSEDIIQGAKAVCDVLRKRGYYTNVNTFSIRCNDCGTRMKGENEAAEHGRKTGHWDMEEAR